jgi:hypothetical protein
VLPSFAVGVDVTRSATHNPKLANDKPTVIVAPFTFEAGALPTVVFNAQIRLISQIGSFILISLNLLLLVKSHKLLAEERNSLIL